MLFSPDDFKLKRANFDLTQSHNMVRILAGLLLLPHALGKFSGAGLNPGTIQFFDTVGFHPAIFMVCLAASAEIVGGVCLALGFATRWAALGVAAIMSLTIFALVKVGGFNWFWGAGGIEYSLFWGLAALAVAITEFKRHAATAASANRP